MYGNEKTAEVGMYGNMMGYVAGQQRDGAVDRPEFDPNHTTSGWPAVPDQEARNRVESYVLKYIPEVHKFAGPDGNLRVIYLDERGRSYDCKIDEVPDSELVRMAKRYGMRFSGEGDPNAPQTSKTDHGYPKPATTEEVDGVGALAEAGNPKPDKKVLKSLFAATKDAESIKKSVTSGYSGWPGQKECVAALEKARAALSEAADRYGGTW